ncbi:IS3 family transposase [Clostridium beijerinckii]
MERSRKKAISTKRLQEYKYISIKELHEKNGYPIADLCNLAGIARSSYYKWINRSETELDKENSIILKEIVKLYEDVNGIYGYRRITMNINRLLDKQYNHKRIYRLMKSINMRSVIRKKRKHYIQSTPQITAENKLNREFYAKKPNEKWLTDVTEFKLLNGKKAYLSAIFDLAVSANPTAKPLFHSDRGFQYTNRTFKAKLDKIKATQSMSRVSRCIDNGPMEGFWGTLKCEMYYLQKFYTYEELRQAIDEYIVFYNTKRLQKNLKGLTPIEYRNQTLVS